MAQAAAVGNAIRVRLGRYPMQQLSPAETALVAAIDPAPMLSQVEAWSAINTGTRNLAGLATQAEALAQAFAGLPGGIELVEGAPVDAVAADGSVRGIGHGRHMVLKVRPEATRRLLLTGHMDTVFASDHAFQGDRKSNV